MFGKELKKALFSIPFLLLAAVTFLMYATQLDGYLGEQKKITQPQPGQSYGTVPSKDPELVMPAALRQLYAEFVSNEYPTYPTGFYHRVKLGEEDQKKMAAILAELSGETQEELLSRIGTEAPQDNTFVYREDEEGNVVREMPDLGEANTLAPAEDIDYSRFEELMAEADSLLGGGSDYAVDSLPGFGTREKTYEEAMAEYEAARDIDKFTGAHARLFCDYMTLFSAWMPAFLMVSECLRDRRAKMRDLIWTRQASSLRITLNRYFAVVLLSMLPILLLAGIDTVRSAGLYAGQNTDALAYLKYALGWTLPTVMFSAAVGLFFTELTDTPIGLGVILVYWIADLNRGLSQMGGGYEGLPLSPRHNSLLGAQTFADQFSVLLADRLFFFVLALVLAGISALILEAKRKGGWQSYDSLKARVFHRRRVPAA